MKCARCGTTLVDGSLVCTQCGAAVGVKYGHTDTPTFNVTGKIAPPPVSPAFRPPQSGASRALLPRVQAMLTAPRNEWRTIAAEPTPTMAVWSGYVLPLALIGPIALAIAQVAFGSVYPLVGLVKASLVTGIAMALLTFTFTLVQVFVLSRVVHAMALRFGAIPDALAALKLVAYSMTPVWLVGIVYLVPVLGFLWLPAAAYAIFLAFIGLPVLMQCPPQKALVYAVTTMAVAVGLWLVTGALVTALMGFGPVMLD